MAKDNTASTTILRPPWLGITRLVWMLVTVLAFILTLLGMAKLWGEPLPACSTPTAACAPWTVSQEDISLAQQSGWPYRAMMAIYFASSVFPKVAFSLVGLLIFWRRSQDWVAQLLAMMLILFCLEGIYNLGPLQPVVDALYACCTLIFCIVPFIFPNGRFVPSWMGWLAIPNAILATLVVFAPQLGLPLTDDLYALLILVPFLIWFLLAGYSTLYRYRYVSNPTERQQTKWAVAGILGAFAIFIPFSIIAVVFPPSSPSYERLVFIYLVFFPIYLASYLFIPGGIAFAILRYRLWDIDIVIRRTLQYGLLTGLLVLVYFGGVIILQWLLSPLTGQANSPLVIVLTTLGIAALFNPLRRRVQAFIDRLFYRKKYTTEQALAAFSTAARDEVDIDLLTRALLNVVDETVQPASSRLWLKKKE